jgi:signal transduction histidine kinase
MVPTVTPARRTEPRVGDRRGPRALGRVRYAPLVARTLSGQCLCSGSVPRALFTLPVLPRPPRSDVLLAGSVCLAAIVCVYASPLSAPNGFARPGDALGMLIAVGMTVPLAWRRRWPLVTLVIVAACSELSNLRNYATDPADLFSWFALGSAAYYTSRRTSIVLAVAATTFELYWWLRWDLPTFSASDVTWAVTVGVVPVSLGHLLRSHHEHADTLAEHERRVSELEAANAVESERLRIARELHDIVGHHLSAIGVHARATALLVHKQPDRASAELQRLSELASTALSETRQSVALMRSGAVQSAPQPRLMEVDQLAQRARAEGLEFHVQRSGTARPLRESLELCAYRVIQEALTNVVKHAPRPASVDVTIGYEPAALAISVVSQAAKATAAPFYEGHGLAGMRERVHLAGGTFKAGPRDPHTWIVRAIIPTSS